jgi:uncharacterized protein (UPF0276 family)
MHNIKELPVLGVGMGYRKRYREDVYRYRDYIDFLEVMSDIYLDCNENSDLDLKEIDILSKYFPLLPHSVGLSIGSAEGIDNKYLHKLKTFIDRIDPPWWSDHLCFTKSHDIDTGHLLQLPFVKESVDVVKVNYKAVSNQIQVPFILENISYLTSLPSATMHEHEFLRTVLDATDCGILLDVTNLYGNSINHGFNALEYLDKIPLDKVVQLHFVGGSFSKEGTYHDDHSHKTPENVWYLMDEVIARTPNIKGVVLERDDNFPHIEEILKELERARDIGKKHKRWT